jgi:hypothetical protein
MVVRWWWRCARWRDWGCRWSRLLSLRTLTSGNHSHVAVEALEDEGYEIGDERQEGAAATWMFNLK